MRCSLARLKDFLSQLDRARSEKSDSATRQERGEMIARRHANVAPGQATLNGDAEMDPAEWAAMDLRVNEPTVELGEALWTARLNAVISSL